MAGEKWKRSYSKEVKRAEISDMKYVTMTSAVVWIITSYFYNLIKAQLNAVL